MVNMLLQDRVVRFCLLSYQTVDGLDVSSSSAERVFSFLTRRIKFAPNERLEMRQAHVRARYNGLIPDDVYEEHKELLCKMMGYALLDVERNRPTKRKHKEEKARVVAEDLGLVPKSRLKSQTDN